MEMLLFFKRVVKNNIVKMSKNKKWSFVISYINHRRRMPNLENPKNLSEILIRRVLDGDIDKIYYLADKYLMRDYIKAKGYGQYLPNLIGVYDKAEEIDFERLPERFALKMNFGAGMNIICTDKSKMDFEATKRQLNNWLMGNSIYSYAETHYNLIQRKIVCEEFIDDGKGGFPLDYKFMCVKGEPMCCLICMDRNNSQKRYLPYNLDWKYLKDWDNQGAAELSEQSSPSKPGNFKEMISIAKTLSRDIPFVRVDLYSDGKRIWIGELTLTPDGCILHRWTMKALNVMGDYYRKH